MSMACRTNQLIFKENHRHQRMSNRINERLVGKTFRTNNRVEQKDSIRSLL